VLPRQHLLNPNLYWATLQWLGPILGSQERAMYFLWISPRGPFDVTQISVDKRLEASDRNSCGAFMSELLSLESGWCRHWSTIIIFSQWSRGRECVAYYFTHPFLRNYLSSSGLEGHFHIKYLTLVILLNFIIKLWFLY